MNLMFQHHEIKLRGRGLTFDDVLIVPAKSEVRSRKDPSLQSRLTQKKTLELPFVAANMDTITETDMAMAMAQLGALGILHRFMTMEQQVAMVRTLVKNKHPIISASIGVGEEGQNRARSLVQAGVNILTLDIAHGHSVQMLELIEWCKKEFPEVEVIAGNVASPQAVADLISAGADSIKVGIGPGSMCTTRIITGCGVPQLTAIAICAEEAKRHNIPIIADGGLRSSGDMMKAFAAGAQTVMLGSLLAGTLETPGEVKSGRKQYRGMASRAAQDSWRGGVPTGMAPEGESTFVSIKGHVKDVIMELAGGVRSGMSYVNASTLHEVSEKSFFMEMSTNGVSESRAHGLSS